ncbi:sodium-dependent transporter [Shouchella clausii]|uniref:sodium-dependent transporter n=1 Tax=Shouchella clausii TaxID=79880 RepID=UPI000BA547BB|nr:sodium-dependent transporter [Shouchella clausii]MEB5478709.1 sodium-dependent transporter [Shouchella clausii]MED4159034.1 sodium-dependent transporter [Shouchella clausii]MED4176833.1 sodium-dependent transporter [Shouchella clausii]PAD16776.1 hypothetical protein CHH74_03335 [Shouchella clausii]
MSEQWTSKIGFILASAGAAIGLGALWRFPYLTGTNGGGAFFLLFILFTVFIGLPLLIAEFVIGRGAKREAVSAYPKLVNSKAWSWIGRFGVVGCFLLMTFYAVVGGWILLYALLSFGNFVLADGRDYEQLFVSITASPWASILGLVLFVFLNVVVLSFGIKNGIERANKYLMPLLFLFLLIIIFRGLSLEGAMEGVRFFLQPDFSKITAPGLLEALGQSFFSLAVGFSCMVTYSSYLGEKQSLPGSAAYVAAMNVFVSLLAGLAIFPIVFAYGIEPASGPGLLFIALPAIFAQMPFGALFLSLFLLLFFFATITSSLSLLEIIISAFTQNKGWNRRNVAMGSGVVVIVAAIPSALSAGFLSRFAWEEKTVFDLTDLLVSNIMLPVGCLLIALFVGYKIKRDLLFHQFQLASGPVGRMAPFWLFLMRTLVPATILLVFIAQFFL